MPRDYTSEYATLAEKFKRATARATTEEQRARVRAVYDRAVTEVAESQQMEAEERRAAGPSGARQVSGAERARGLTRAAAQGATFGFGEEAEALVRSLAPGKTYGEEVKRIRGEMQAYREAEPGKAMAAEIAGGFVPGLGLATKAVQGVRGAGAVAKALTKSAGLQGALAGAGTTEGGLAERAAGASVGGTVGGVLGYGTGRAAEVVGRGIARARLGGGIRRGPVGARVIERAAEQEGVTDLAGALRSAQAAGVPEQRVMDVMGPSGQRMAVAIQRIGGKAGKMVEETMKGRAETASERMLRATTSTGRLRENIVKTVDELIDEGQVASKPLYRAFERSPATEIPRIDALLNRPFVQQAIREARELAQNQGRRFIEPAQEATVGRIVSETGEPLTKTAAKATRYFPQSLDDIKKAMDDIIYTGKYGNVTAGQGGIAPGKLEQMKKIRSEFVKAIDEAYPETYAEARRAWSGPAANRAAVLDGQEAAMKNISPDMIAKDVAEASGSELEFYQRGYLEVLRQKIDDGKLSLKAIDEPGFANRIRSVFGDEGDTIVEAMRQQAELTATGQRLRPQAMMGETMQELQGAGVMPMMGRAIRSAGPIIAPSPYRPTRSYQTGLANIADFIQGRLGAPVQEANRIQAARTLMTPTSNIGELITTIERERAARLAGQQARQRAAGATSRFLGAETIRRIGGK